MLGGELARRNPPFTGDRRGITPQPVIGPRLARAPWANWFYGLMVRLKSSGTIYPVQGSCPMRALWISFVPLFVAALLSSAGLTRAQMVIRPDRAAPAPPDLGHPALPGFSMQQRAAIYRSVVALTKEHSTVPLPLGTQVEVGTKLPEATELYPVPDDVRTQIAASSNYEYAVWKHQVLLVDPAKRTVVDILHGDVLSDYDKPK